MDLGSGFRDRGSGSGKNLFRIPDPGSRGQKGTGSRIRIRNTEKIKNICLGAFVGGHRAKGATTWQWQRVRTGTRIAKRRSLSTFCRQTARQSGASRRTHFGNEMSCGRTQQRSGQSAVANSRKDGNNNGGAGSSEGFLFKLQDRRSRSRSNDRARASFYAQNIRCAIN